MNFIESTNFFVRTIMFDFINRDKNINLKFRLTPMIHIGSKEYYESVLDHIKSCDEIFYEGIALIKKEEKLYNKISLKNLGLTFYQYKVIADKLGLVTQSEYFDLNELKEKLTHSDFNPESGEEAWKNLTLKEKIKLSFIDPLKLFVFHQGITREILAKNFMTSRQEAYLAYGPIEDELGTSRNFIMNEREQLIFKNIRRRLNAEASLDKTIGIVYGAGHMKSIARYLIDNFNYVPRNGKFMKVFDIN